MNMPSETVTHDSDWVMAAAPKFPSSAPRSGTTTFSVRRITRNFSGSHLRHEQWCTMTHDVVVVRTAPGVYKE